VKSCGEHADRLRLRLGFDRLLDGHRPFLVQHGLGDAVGEGRAVGELAGQRLRLGSSASGGTARLKKPQRSPSSPSQRPAGVEQLAGAALADDARQHGARAHVATGQADAVEQEGGLAAGVP
jgi:hypothetical protein